MKTIYRISVLVLFSTILLLGSCAVSQGVQFTIPVGSIKTTNSIWDNYTSGKDCPHLQNYKSGMHRGQSYSEQGKYFIFCHKCGRYFWGIH
jgi:hypothetical protein